jgi:hypothetical protein
VALGGDENLSGESFQTRPHMGLAPVGSGGVDKIDAYFHGPGHWLGSVFNGKVGLDLPQNEGSQGKLGHFQTGSSQNVLPQGGPPMYVNPNVAKISLKTSPPPIHPRAGMG